MSIDFGNDIYEEPIVAKTFLQEDAQEGSLRPKTLREYIGQEKAKGNLEVFIQAAKMRHEPLDHVLLHGPPGLGKTTLSGIIANEMGVNVRITSGPAIEKAGVLAALLTNLNENDILFVDEIHRLNRAVEEVLYLPWRTTPSTSSSARGPQLTPSAWTCPGSPSSGPLPGPDSCPPPCGTDSV